MPRAGSTGFVVKLPGPQLVQFPRTGSFIVHGRRYVVTAGHEVTFVVYTGFEDLSTALPADTDVLFIGAFSESAQLSYAISNMYRQRGTITVLGCPHARCYPEDAAQYFDYVLGFTDKSLIVDVLNDKNRINCSSEVNRRC